MKRILGAVLLGMALLAFGPAQSQQTMTNSVDTLTNATTGYATLQVNAAVDLLTIQVVVTKVSGTVAGTALPQASIDGVNYVDISTDTLTLANVASNLKVWAFTKSPYKYYRVKVTTTGTQVSIPAAKMFTRQPPKG